MEKVNSQHSINPWTVLRVDEKQKIRGKTVINIMILW